MRSPVLVLILFVITLSAQAQGRPGYIVDLSGTTHPGLISLQSTTSKYWECSFKEQPDSIYTIYHPADIRGYGIMEGEHFEAEPLTEGGKVVIRFFKVETEGPVSLLSYFDRIFIKSDELLELVNAPKKAYRITISSVLTDCSMQQQIWHSSFEIRALSRLVEVYNTCADNGIVTQKLWHSSIAFMSSAEKSRYYNFTSNFIAFPYGFVRDHERPAIGARLTLSSDYLNDVELSLGLFAKKRKFFGEGVGNQAIRQTLIMRFDEIDFDATLHYLVHPLGGSPTNGAVYINGGFRIPFTLRAAVDLQQELVKDYGGQPTIVIDYLHNVLSSAKMTPRALIGIGYRNYLTKKIKWFTEMNFDFGGMRLRFNSFLPYSNFKCMISEFAIAGGINF